MFITNGLLLLEYPKAASSYLRHFVKLYFNFEIKKRGVHNSIKSENLYKKIKINEIKVLGSVRNPYSFYVSLRAFDINNSLKDGYDSRIGLNRSLFSKPGLKSLIKNPSIIFRDLSAWENTYCDSYSTENFQKWITLFINKKTNHVDPLYHKVSHKMGFATFFYFKLYTELFHKNYKELLNNKLSLEDYYEKFKYPIVIVKTESVYDDLIESSKCLGLKQEKVMEILDQMQAKKSGLNQSKSKNYKEYYSKEIIDLIQKKDGWLINKYNYQFNE
jgi:hypothetical protein